MTPTDLKAERAALGLTQRELAELLDIPQATVSRWESGHHKIQHPEILRMALHYLELRA